MKTLEYRMRHSFPDKDLAIQQMQEGYDGRYLKFEKNGKIVGVALLNIDHTWSNDNRAYIRHISVKEREDFNPVLFLTIDYVWNKMLADNLRVDLYHVKEPAAKNSGESGDEFEDNRSIGSTFSVQTDGEIKTALCMNKTGFRWKMLINDPATGMRYQIMQMNKPLMLEVDKESVLKARRMKLN